MPGRTGHNCFPVFILKQDCDKACRIHCMSLKLTLTRECAHCISCKIEKLNGFPENSKDGSYNIFVL